MSASVWVCISVCLHQCVSAPDAVCIVLLYPDGIGLGGGSGTDWQRWVWAWGGKWGADFLLVSYPLASSCPIFCDRKVPLVS